MLWNISYYGDIDGVCEFSELDDIYDEAEGGGACVTCYK